MIKCDAVWNEAHYCDEASTSSSTAGTTLNEDERVQAYKDIQRILIERGRFIITSFWAMNSAISNGLTASSLKLSPAGRFARCEVFLSDGRFNTKGTRDTKTTKAVSKVEDKIEPVVVFRFDSKPGWGCGSPRPVSPPAAVSAPGRGGLALLKGLYSRAHRPSAQRYF